MVSTFGIFCKILSWIEISLKMPFYLAFFASLLMSLILAFEAAADCTISWSLTDLAFRLSRTCLSLSLRSWYSIFVPSCAWWRIEATCWPKLLSLFVIFLFRVWFEVKNTRLEYLTDCVLLCFHEKKSNIDLKSCGKCSWITVSGLFSHLEFINSGKWFCAQFAQQ